MAAINPPKVIIVGAGMGGLALAQALRKHSIPFEIFERDETQYSRSQGWSLALHWILPHLVSEVPADMPSLQSTSVVAALGVTSEMCMYDGVTKERQFHIGNQPRNFIRVNRAEFRKWLLTNIPVQWGKMFDRYEQTPEGVKVHFTDGTCVEGDVLVGADGVNSRVRDQLLSPNPPQPKVVPVGSVIGQVDLPRAAYERQMSYGRSGMMASAAPTRLFIGIKYIEPDLESARYIWMVNFIDEKAKEPDFWTHTMPREEQLAWARKRVEEAGIAEEFTEIMKYQKPEEMQETITIRTMVPQELPEGRVTLLGDAAHPMTPFRGEGACQSIFDAIMLARLLNTEARLAAWCLLQPPELPAVLKRYEKEMIQRTTEAVLESEKAANMEMRKAPLNSGYDVLSKALETLEHKE